MDKEIISVSSDNTYGDCPNCKKRIFDRDKEAIDFTSCIVDISKKCTHCKQECVVEVEKEQRKIEIKFNGWGFNKEFLHIATHYWGK